MKEGRTQEDDWLPGISQGDESAFRQLVYKYHTLLYDFIAGITRDNERAEEITQDIFLQIWMARESLSIVKNFRAYLFVMARNQALNALRSALREKKRLEKWQQSEIISSTEQDEDLLHARKSLIHLAIRQLPAQQQTAWTMSRQDGKKYQEIAEQMNISRETVKKHIQLANQSILSYIEQHIAHILLVIAAANRW